MQSRLSVESNALSFTKVKKDFHDLLLDFVRGNEARFHYTPIFADEKSDTFSGLTSE